MDERSFHLNNESLAYKYCLTQDSYFFQARADLNYNPHRVFDTNLCESTTKKGRLGENISSTTFLLTTYIW